MDVDDTHESIEPLFLNGLFALLTMLKALEVAFSFSLASVSDASPGYYYRESKHAWAPASGLQSLQVGDVTIIFDKVVSVTEMQLEILLFEAERGWAYAMDLKAEIRDEPRKRLHMIKRLKRAAESAQKLSVICDRVADARTKLDVQAYASLMNGYILFEHQRWESALDKFAIARAIYQQLALSGTAEQVTMCEAAVDTIDPNIRYCAYSLKTPAAQTAPIDNLVKSRVDLGLPALAADSNVKREDPIATIAWRGSTIPIRNPKLHELLLQIPPRVADVSQAGPAKAQPKLDAQLQEVDELLKLVKQAIVLAKGVVREDEIAVSKVKSSKSDQISAQLQLALAFVTFQHMLLVLRRNTIRVGIVYHRIATQSSTISKKKLARPTDALTIYDESLKEVNELRAFSVLDTDVGMQNYLDATLCLVDAEKALSAGGAFATRKEHSESLVLFDRASEFVAQARANAEVVARLEGSGVDSGIDVDKLKQDIQAVDMKVRSAKVREQARAFLDERKNPTGVNALEQGVADLDLKEKPPVVELPLAERLDTFVTSFDPANPNLVAFPPNVRPVPYKPMFFDLAFNGIDFPTRNTERRAAGLGRLKRSEAEAKTEEEADKGKGLLGVLGGFWGRK
ncbi:signal recognition particle subunit srp68 [Thoreauomyces humboldtii]|nr:signal recognition particle subunit srp68 [Thoreauomyces humboldtii]